MKKTVIQKSILNSFNFLNAESIEKARKGEMIGGAYIYRESIAEKETVKNGKKVVKRYNYYYIKDMLKDSADTILSKIGKFFFKKNPDEVKRIEKSYTENNIEKDFKADKKTYFQHVMEYLSHRTIWDKRFSDEGNRKKFKKPIIMEVSEKIDIPEMETPIENEPVIQEQPKEKEPEKKPKQPKEKPAWKANPSLMRKIWAMYTGATIEKQEKEKETVNKNYVLAGKDPAMAIKLNAGDKYNIDGKIYSFIKMNDNNAPEFASLDGEIIDFDSVQEFNSMFNDKKIIATIPEKTNEENDADLLVHQNEAIDIYFKQAKNWGIDKEKALYDIRNLEINRANIYYQNPKLVLEIANKYYPPKITDIGEGPYIAEMIGDNGDIYRNHFDTREKAEKSSKNHNAFGFESKVVEELPEEKQPETKENDYVSVINDLINTKKTKETSRGIVSKSGELLKEVCKKLPADKIEAIKNACARNNALTSYYGLENCVVTVYPSGIYFQLEGTRSNASIYVNKNGEITRKKNEEALYSTSFKTDNYVDLRKLESPAEEHENRSNAMLGNDNAKKFNMSAADYNKFLNSLKQNIVTWLDIKDGKFIAKDNIMNSRAGFFGNAIIGIKAGEEVPMSTVLPNMKRVMTLFGTDTLKGYAKNSPFKSMDKFLEEFINTFKNDNPNYNPNNDKEFIDFIGNIAKDDPSVFELYGISGEHGNKIAMLGNQNAKKDGIIEAEENNGSNKDNIEQGRISGGNKNLRKPGSADSNENVSGYENGSDTAELHNNVVESGVGPQIAEGLNIGDGSGKLTPGQARKIREACKKLLETKTDEQMTEADKALLSQYVGAGGNKEKDASNLGVLTEFYTPRNVVNKCWQLMDKWLPNKKTCIEPSSGIGRFAEGRKEKFTMFEFDKDSARIAKILHPEADVKQGYFEANFVRDGMFNNKSFEKFDCAVGNPPYMDYTGIYRGQGEGKEFKRYESYFIDRTLKTLKENGVLVMVVPSGMLNSKNNDRTYGKDMELIAKNAELLEAWRLPNGSFDSTNVGTDIIVLRKTKNGGNVEDFKNGNYFKKNPSHIAGEEVETKDWRGKDIKIVRPLNGETEASAIDNINVNDIEAIIKELSAAETEITEKPQNALFIPNDKKIFDEIETPEGKGKINGYVFSNKVAIGYSVTVAGKDVKVYFTNPLERNRKISEVLKGNQNAKGHHFIASTGKNMTAEEFAHKYGFDVNKKDLEIWKFTNYDGTIDTSKLTEEQKEYINNSKNYVKDGNNIVNVVNYASGNIREKLNELEVELKGNEIKQEDYEFKKSLLEAAMPVIKEVGEFQMSPIADWTRKYLTKDGINLIQGFYEWAYNGAVDFDDSELPVDSPIAPEEIPAEISFSDIVDYIDKKEVRTSRSDGDKIDRQKIRYRKSEKRRETAEYLFNKYLKEGLSQSDQDDLTKAWNDNFNTYKNPDYTKIPIFVDGMNEKMGTYDFTLTPQQLKGISFLTNKGSGLLAYDVGVGKTVTGLCATVNQIQTGRAKRPIICVPNAVYENWIAEIHQHFPNIKVNEVHNFGKMPKDWRPEDGSLTLCTYEALQKMTFHEEAMEEIHTDVEFAKLDTSDKKKSQRKEAQESEKLNELVGSMTKTTNDYVYFDDMGFDHITVDEIHNFKNIFYAPRNVSIKIDDENQAKESNEFRALSGGRSDRGEKLFAITQYIQRHNNDRNVFGLSATPFQNSPIEIYNILSLFARKKMKDLGIYSLEEFVKQFAKLKSEYVVTATNVEEKMVMKSFNNLTALQNLITEYIDKVDGGEAHVIRPKKVTHLPELTMTETQKTIMEAESAYLAAQAELPNDERDLGATLASLNAMRMATLSPALVNESRYEIYRDLGYNIEKPAYKDVVESSPKLKFVCDSVIAQYKNAPDQGQVIYMPKGVEQFKYVTDYLVKHGVPREAVAEMAGGGGEKSLEYKEQKTREFNDVNQKCKIIIGSETIKEGVNLNGNSTVLYNCMLGWNPTETQQVEGRIWRQGNKQGITHIVYPLLHDSIDPMLYQKYDEKKSRINDIFSYKGNSLNVDEIDAEELKYKLIKDPQKRADLQTRQYKEKAEADQKLYAKMIDVLAKQSAIAFENLEENATYIAAQKRVEAEQRKYDVFMTSKKTWEAKLKASEGNPVSQEVAKKQLDNINSYLTSEKRVIDGLKKEPNRIKNAQKSMIVTLAKRGIKNWDDVDKKRNEYAKLMIQARNNAEKADELKEQFYQQAIKDNEAASGEMPTLEEATRLNIDSIRGNLHPMDEEFKAKLIAENEKMYKKSMFFIYGGRFFVRK